MSTLEVNAIKSRTGTDITIESGASITGTASQFKITGGTAGQALITDGAGGISFGAAGSSLPTQTGQSGKFLTTDGTDTSWTTVDHTHSHPDELPSQSGQAGEFLKTDGTTVSWEAVVTDPTMGGDMTGTASNAQIAADAVGIAELATTGTASSSTFLAGNMAWSIVQGSEITTPNNFFKNWNEIASSFTTTVGASENAGVVGPIAIATGNTWSIGGGTVKIL